MQNMGHVFLGLVYVVIILLIVEALAILHSYLIDIRRLARRHAADKREWSAWLRNAREQDANVTRQYKMIGGEPVSFDHGVIMGPELLNHPEGKH